VSFDGNCVGKGDIFVGYSKLWLFRISGVSNARWMCMRVLLVAERGLGRGR
jgi:hypothetical protein